MARVFGALFAVLLALGQGGPAPAADDTGKDVTAILDRAIKALGGEEKLSKSKAFSWKAKGQITINGDDNPFTSQTVVRGLNHLKTQFEGEFGGNKITGVTVLAGDKGWRKFGDNLMELDGDALANEKRTLSLIAVPVTVVALKGKGFKVKAAGGAKVAGKPAVGVKATGPDGKDFTLYFDKETGLPVKLVARVVGFMGEEYKQETLFSDYKVMGGVKKATKIRSTRDGEKFIEQTISDFKALDKVDDKTFAEPE